MLPTLETLMHTPFYIRLPLLAAALLLLGATGCGQDPGYEYTYTVRAIVKSLPGDRATDEFIVHHETIPDYQSINGSVGMNEMMMPIPVPNRLALAGLQVGDKIELTFGERFEPDHRMGLISAKKLPDDTVMNLGNAKAPGEDAKKPPVADDEGFVSIIDGKTLDGWEGDPVYWRVEDGSLIGEITPETLVKRNSFIVWDGEVADFELKIEYRITKGGNSGIQYRSKMDENDPYAMVGYQADIENGSRWTGQNYEERGRKFLAKRGESVVLENGKKPRVVEQIGDPDELNKKVFFDDRWNAYHLVVKGNRMIHFVNGVRMSEVLDNDETNRAMKGLLGVQVHTGPPMKVEFRSIRLKTYE